MKYRVFNCECCGEQTIDRSPGQNRKYCSEACSQKRYRMSQGVGFGMKIPPCKYNQAVGCTARKCNNCGWNPAVEKLRKAAIVGG